MQTLILLGIAPLLFLLSGAGTAPPKVAAKAAPKRLSAFPVAPHVTWDGPQFLQSDKKGNVFLLRADTLTIFPVEERQLGEPHPLADGETTLDGPISDAVLSQDGQRWDLLTSNQILSFEEGKKKKQPNLGWLATDLAVARDKPLVGVLPMSLGRGLTSSRPADPPLVLSLGDSRWETLIQGAAPRRRTDVAPMNALFADYTVDLEADQKGRIWLAYPYTGKIVRFTPGGRPDLEITIGDGAAKHKPDEEARLQKFKGNLEKQGYRTKGATAGVFTAKRLILGATANVRDQSYYLVLSSAGTEKGTALARFDPAASTVETVPLQLSYNGELSLTAGGDGLYFASTKGAGGRWYIPWDAVDQASWAVLDGVEVRGR